MISYILDQRVHFEKKIIAIEKAKQNITHMVVAGTFT